MSTNRLKKHLQSLTKEQIVEVVLDAYNNSKAVQEYFDFYLQPNEKEKIKKYKAIISTPYFRHQDRWLVHQKSVDPAATKYHRQWRAAAARLLFL